MLLSFQRPVHAACLKHIRTKKHIEFAGLKIHAPAVVNASVSSGKSVMIAELADAVHKAGIARGNKVRILVIQRIGILCEQNSEAGWSIDLKNSVYSASAFGGRKSLYYDVCFCTEGTIARALDIRFAEDKPWQPDLILIDECHMVNFDDRESQFLKTLLHFYKIKPHLRLIGYTGSPFRGMDSIIGPFWSGFVSMEPDDPLYPEGGEGNGLITTEAMISGGWVVGPQFGMPMVHGYDFSSVDWTVDDERELNKLTESEQLLAEILTEVIGIAQTRKGVLIFASTKRHARNIVAMLERLGVEPDKIGLIVDSTPEKDKTRILKSAQTGEIKYTVNVGVLTTGINCPWWDLLVFLRPIGSLTLLIQAIGRVLRLLIGPDEMPMIERDALTAEERKDLIAASEKPDALILDYASVLDRLGKLYENPVLEQAELERAKKKNELIDCQECGTQNSIHARRCIGVDKNKQRCDHFWVFRLCPHCGIKNDVVARQCRNAECSAELIDPNEKLSKTHFKDAEAIPVVSMDLSCGPGGALYVKWELTDGRKPIEIYYPNASKNPVVTTRAWFNNFCKEHVESEKGQYMARRMKNNQAVAMKTIFRVPTHIIARQNEKGKWAVGKRYFAVEQVEEMV